MIDQHIEVIKQYKFQHKERKTDLIYTLLSVKRRVLDYERKIKKKFHINLKVIFKELMKALKTMDKYYFDTPERRNSVSTESNTYNMYDSRLKMDEEMLLQHMKRKQIRVLHSERILLPIREFLEYYDKGRSTKITKPFRKLLIPYFVVIHLRNGLNTALAEKVFSNESSWILNDGSTPREVISYGLMTPYEMGSRSIIFGGGFGQDWNYHEINEDTMLMVRAGRRDYIRGVTIDESTRYSVEDFVKFYSDGKVFAINDKFKNFVDDLSIRNRQHATRVRKMKEQMDAEKEMELLFPKSIVENIIMPYVSDDPIDLEKVEARARKMYTSSS